MRQFPRLRLLPILLLAASCAAPTPTGGGPASEPGASGPPKRITAAIMGNANALLQVMNPSSAVPGIDTLQDVVNAGLIVADDRGGLLPQLAEAVPTIENGLWKILPDGRMETTWRIKSNARWHDGAPVVPDDLLFTATVGQDQDLPLFAEARLRSLESVEAVDARTVTARWKQTFIGADRLFTSDLAFPLPKHLLAAEYTANKTGFVDLTYWSSTYVGSGAFKLREFQEGSHLVLEAFDQYVLGRPKIDLIEIKFIPDANTLVANVLAGVVELTLGRSISVEQGVQITERWPDGRAQVAPYNLLRIIPQFANPTPPVILDLRFRRALLHAIDRQEMVDTLLLGQSQVAHSFFSPSPQYRELEDRNLVRYPFDPRQAATILEELGYRRGADGMLRDAAGQPLTVDSMVGVGQEVNVKTAYAVADYWKRAGVDARVTPEALSSQLSGVERRRAQVTWPGFTVIRSNNDADGLLGLTTDRIGTAETGWVGGNRGRYSSPDLDRLIDRYFITIPARERLDILGQILHHISDQLPLMPLFYGAEPAIVAHRLQNVGARPTGTSAGWNAHLWEVK